ncbi:MAG: HEAT repeat domain-containing protein [Bacteroidota bacterium]
MILLVSILLSWLPTTYSLLPLYPPFSFSMLSKQVITCEKFPSIAQSITDYRKEKVTLSDLSACCKELVNKQHCIEVYFNHIQRIKKIEFITQFTLDLADQKSNTAYFKRVLENVVVNTVYPFPSKIKIITKTIIQSRSHQSRKLGFKALIRIDPEKACQMSSFLLKHNIEKHLLIVKQVIEFLAFHCNREQTILALVEHYLKQPDDDGIQLIKSLLLKMKSNTSSQLEWAALAAKKSNIKIATLVKNNTLLPKVVSSTSLCTKSTLVKLLMQYRKEKPTFMHLDGICCKKNNDYTCLNQYTQWMQHNQELHTNLTNFATNDSFFNATTLVNRLRLFSSHYDKLKYELIVQTLLKDPNPINRKVMLEYVMEALPSQVAGLVIDILRQDFEKNPSIRMEMIRLLSKFSQTNIIPTLLELAVVDISSEVRQLALNTLLHDKYKYSITM